MSSLLWNMVVNNIFFKLNYKGAKEVISIDDIVFLIKGNFLATIPELMVLEWGSLLEQTRENGLGVNPS